MGIFEIISVAVLAIIAGLVHLVALLVCGSKQRKCPRWMPAIYGIPLCYVIGALVTPPDLISALTVGAILTVAYIIAAWILIARCKA